MLRSPEHALTAQVRASQPGAGQPGTPGSRPGSEESRLTISTPFESTGSWIGTPERSRLVTRMATVPSGYSGAHLPCFNQPWASICLNKLVEASSMARLTRAPKLSFASTVGGERRRREAPPYPDPWLSAEVRSAPSVRPFHP